MLCPLRILWKRKLPITAIVIFSCMLLYTDYSIRTSRTSRRNMANISFNHIVGIKVIKKPKPVVVFRDEHLPPKIPSGPVKPSSKKSAIQKPTDTVCEMNRSKINPFEFEEGYLLPRQLKRIKNQVELTKTLKDCAPFHFSKVKLPSTALASFPGSGNTWTRYLLQQLTGIFTGGIYHTLIISDRKYGMVNYMPLSTMNRNGSVIAFKTHLSIVGPTFDKAIVIIRNPYEAIIAEYHRLMTFMNYTYYESGHLEHVPEEMFHDARWSQHVQRHTNEWYQFYLAWLDAGRYMKIHLLHYNNLKNHLRDEIIKLGRFLDVDDCVLANTTHIQCVLDNSGDGMKRKGIRFTKSPFTAAMNYTLDNYIWQIRSQAKRTLNITLDL